MGRYYAKFAYIALMNSAALTAIFCVALDDISSMILQIKY